MNNPKKDPLLNTEQGKKQTVLDVQVCRRLYQNQCHSSTTLWCYCPSRCSYQLHHPCHTTVIEIQHHKLAKLIADTFKLKNTFNSEQSSGRCNHVKNK